MKMLVITPPEEVHHEIETIHELFHVGLEILHLRKPDYKLSQMEKLVQSIDSKYHHRIMLHGHHTLKQRYQFRGLHFTARQRHNSGEEIHTCQSTSCHSIEELETCESHFEYMMISPVFDSISKPGYYAGIDSDRLQRSISCHNRKVVALGGVTPWNLEQLPSNCWGAAVLGWVWNHETVGERILSFKKLLAGAERL